MGIKMKKLLLIAMLALPMVGCASLTSWITPGSLPQDGLDFVGVTNAPKSFLGLYSNKNDVEALEQQVQNQHRRNVLEFTQVADREGLDFQIALGLVTDSLQDASMFESETVAPVINWGTSAIMGLLGLGTGAAFIKRRGDVTPEQKDKEVLKAGLTDPEEFRKTVAT